MFLFPKKFIFAHQSFRIKYIAFNFALRVIEEQHQTSTTQSTSAQGFNKVHVVNEQQQRLQITSTLLEQQRVEILNEDQKVQLTSLLSTEQQKHITNLLNVGSGTGKLQGVMGGGNFFITASIL